MLHTGHMEFNKDTIQVHHGKCRIQGFWRVKSVFFHLLQVPQLYGSAMLNCWSIPLSDSADCPSSIKCNDLVVIVLSDGLFCLWSFFQRLNGTCNEILQFNCFLQSQVLDFLFQHCTMSGCRKCHFDFSPLTLLV